MTAPVKSAWRGLSAITPPLPGCAMFSSMKIIAVWVLGKWLMETVHSHPELQGLRRWMLATKDAHGLYSQFGWVPLEPPERWMMKIDG